MKTLLEQYEDVLDQSKKCPPRSKRKTVLMNKLVELMRKRISRESIQSRRLRRAA